jgi:hypothetical protein
MQVAAAAGVVAAATGAAAGVDGAMAAAAAGEAGAAAAEADRTGSTRSQRTSDSVETCIMLEAAKNGPGCVSFMAVENGVPTDTVHMRWLLKDIVMLFLTQSSAVCCYVMYILRASLA